MAVSHLGVELGAGHDVVDEADVLRARGRDALAGEEELRRVGAAHLGQADDGDDGGAHAEPHLGEAKLGLRRDDGDVDGGGEADAPTGGVACDAADDGLRRVDDVRHQVGQRVTRRRGGRLGLEVGARAEGVASVCEQNHADVVVGLRGGEVVADRFDERDAQRVLVVGIIQRDGRYSICHCVQGGCVHKTLRRRLGGPGASA